MVRAYDGPLEVRLVDASQRRGASHARNMRVQAARGNFLLFCDSDDIVEPNWIAALLAPHRQRPDAIIAGTLHHDRFNDEDARHACTLSPDPPRPAQGHDALATDPAPFGGYLPTAPGGSFAIDRDTYLRVGGMDSSYPGHSDETDFVWRVQLAGVPVIYSSCRLRAFRNCALPPPDYRSSNVSTAAHSAIRKSAPPDALSRYRNAGSEHQVLHACTVTIDPRSTHPHLVASRPLAPGSLGGRSHRHPAGDLALPHTKAPAHATTHPDS